jgi:3-hydroxyacyl-CoA dehydrogenase / 3-hydroxy-2-methylbutyryl-CoA dehydrogenase
MKIEDVVAVITGGASGLGEATARLLVSCGGKVALLDMNAEKGVALASELGPTAIFCKTDVTDEKSTKEAIDKTMEAFGAINVNINCAGVGAGAKVLSKRGPMDMNSFRKVLDINLMGTINTLRLAAEKMMDNEPNEDGERGVVISTASTAAFDGQIGQAAYSASKAALVGMTLPIAREFADYGIRVMTIAPGLFDTPMMESLPPEIKKSLEDNVPFPRRLGRPSEYAALSKHIIENAMLNGETVRLDGSLRMAAR